MRRNNNTVLFWVAILGLLTIAYFSASYLFAWPLILALVLTYTISRAWYFLLLIAIVAELFSQLPPGIMSVAIFTPWLFLRIPARPSPDLTVFFGLYIFLISFVQVVVLWVGLLWLNFPFREPFSLPLLWAHVPAYWMWVTLTTTATSLLAIIVWYELIAPYRVTRTVPRFKI